ncbi:hypothetical protein VNO77_32989 [Canavalia gladiata]|uniref:Uncharacterized protein n=1 Tax=Canavalia gladiata TaxID=3824 RepID=A0AAN9PW01_CANGL
MNWDRSMDSALFDRTMKEATRSVRSIFTTKLNFQKLGRERECVCCVVFSSSSSSSSSSSFLRLLHFLLQIPLFFFPFSLYNLRNLLLFLSLQLRLLLCFVWIEDPLNFGTLSPIYARCSRFAN